MEKDVGKIKKNDNTDIIIRVDDFGGKIGVTIREFTNDQRTGYKGFTKAGTRITADQFQEFKNMINSISLEGLQPSPEAIAKAQAFKDSKRTQSTLGGQKSFQKKPSFSDISEEDLM
ncbi:Uncharacterised protein [uncultured archaeon]|nr:Uncharacterised protein [uncultured archaeon]